MKRYFVRIFGRCAQGENADGKEHCADPSHPPPITLPHGKRHQKGKDDTEGQRGPSLGCVLV